MEYYKTFQEYYDLINGNTKVDEPTEIKPKAKKTEKKPAKKTTKKTTKKTPAKKGAKK